MEWRVPGSFGRYDTQLYRYSWLHLHVKSTVTFRATANVSTPAARELNPPRTTTSCHQWASLISCFFTIVEDVSLAFLLACANTWFITLKQIFVAHRKPIWNKKKWVTIIITSSLDKADCTTVSFIKSYSADQFLYLIQVQETFFSCFQLFPSSAGVTLHLVTSATLLWLQRE